MLPVHGNIVWRVQRNRDVLHLQLLMALTREELKTCFAIPKKQHQKKKVSKLPCFSVFFSFFGVFKEHFDLEKESVYVH